MSIQFTTEERFIVIVHKSNWHVIALDEYLCNVQLIHKSKSKDKETIKRLRTNIIKHINNGGKLNLEHWEEQ
jgi:uncharacterized protein YbcI